MRRLAAAAMLALIAAPASARGEPVATAGAPIHLGTSYTVRSAVTGDTREVNVWLPTNYASSRDRFPVVYVLDGGLDQDFRHIAALGYLASLSWTFGPFIVVGVQTRERAAELTPPATDARYRTAFPKAGGAAAFRDFLRRDVIPFVDARFRTDGRRALMGESLAGLFVINTLLTQPALFDDYVAVSPSLWWDDRRAYRSIVAPREMTGKRLYLAVADEGGTMQDGVDRVRAFLTGLPPGAVTMRYADLGATTTHATIYHRAAEDALRWLYPAALIDTGPTPWFMVEGAAPPPPTPAARR